MADQRKKLSPADWATIVTLYSRGEKTVRDLAEQFKVTPQAIHQGLRQRGVQKASGISDVLAEVEDAATAKRKEKVAAAHKKAEDYGKYTDVLVQLTIKKITEAHNAGGISTVNADIITLKNGMAIVAKGRQENWIIGKVDELMQESEELAQLNVGEYTEEELAAIREANEEAYQQTLDEVDGLNLDDEEFDLDTSTEGDPVD